MTIAHAGLGLTVLGITGVSIWQTETIVAMKPNTPVAHAGYAVTLEEVQTLRGPNYIAERGKLVYRRDGAVAAVLQPERRLYAVQRRATTEAAIRTTVFADLYATLGESDGQGGWTVRLYHNPLAPWIWLGAAAAALGGFVSLSDRRLRIGAPRRARTAAVQPAE
jgi:cytochrome c-type biogenesis protein CcmF